MNRIWKRAAALLLGAAAAVSMAAPAGAAWRKDAFGRWSYRQNGVSLTGWQRLDGTWYYFDGAGIMKTGWVRAGGVWYYCDAGGAMATGWRWVNGRWYYLNPNGSMRTGWLLWKGDWYYLDSSGAMVTGWRTVGEKTYYLDGGGRMATGAVLLDGTLYVFGDDGALTGDPDQAAWSARVLELVNEARAEAGVSPLAPSATLQAEAAVRARECAEQFSHTRPDGTPWNTIFREYPQASGTLGENLAENYFSPEDVVAAWLASQGHRANLLNPDFNYLGTAFYRSESSIEWAQLFAQTMR